MQIQDFSTQNIDSKFGTSNLGFRISETIAASMIFLLPILVLFALSVNQ